MNFNKLNSWLDWAIYGGFLGGLIAIVGFVVFSMMSLPPADSDWMSVILFLIPRIIIGAMVAAIAGPMLTKQRQ